MPDRDGRIGFNDWMSMTKALNGIQQNNDRRAVRKENGEIRRAFSAIDAGENPSAKDGYSPKALKTAFGMQADIAQNKTALQGYQQKAEGDSRVNQIVQHYQQNGFDAQLPPELLKGADGLRSQAQAMKLINERDEVKELTRKTQKRIISQDYIGFDTSRKYVNEMTQSGDITSAANGLMEMAKKIKMPYLLDDFDPETQTFSKKYLDSKTGGHSKTERVSMPELMSQMNSMSDKQFTSTIASSMQATKQGNEEKWANPIRTQKDGRDFLVIPQKNIYDPSDVDYIVTDEATGEQKIIKTAKEMFNLGFRKEDLKWEKARADIDKTRRADSGTPTKLEKLISARDKYPEGSPNRKLIEQAIIKESTRSGMRIETGPDGTLIQTNVSGAEGLTAKSKNDVQGNIMDANATYSDMKATIQGYDDKYLKGPAQLGYSLDAFKEKWNLGSVSEDEKRELQEYTSFKRDSVSSLNNYIKQITGAAMSEVEAKRLMKAMPNPGVGLFDGDSPTQFKAKLDGVIKNLDRVIARNNYISKHGLSSVKNVGLKQIDGIIDQRGEALEKEIKKQYPGKTNQELEAMVIKALSEEFGVRF